MNNDVFDSEENFFNQKEGRPVFLTVIIILTWISVISAVASSVYSLANSGNATDQMEESMAVFDQIPNDNPILEKYMEDIKIFSLASIQHMRAINLSNLVLYLIEGFAALLMFNLKKIGLWLYIACQIGFVVVFYAFYPASNIMTTFTLVFVILFSLLFIILYSVNTKFLKN